MKSPIRPDHPQLVAMRDGMNRARELWDKKDYAGARLILDPIAAGLAALDVSSPQLDWTLGVTLDYLDEEEASLAHLERALATDPLFCEAQRSIEVVLGNARRSLAAGDLPDESPRVATLYHLLQRRDSAGRGAHLVFSRHLIARGELSEARSLLEAMIRLYSPAVDIFSLMAVCTERLGDTEAALRARGEVERLRSMASIEVESGYLRHPDDPALRRPVGQPS